MVCHCSFATFLSKIKFVFLLKSMGDNNQKYKCSKCKSFFPSDSSLRYHIEKDHQNIRWSCDKCDKVLFTKSGLREHVRSVHEKIRFKCHICGITNRTERSINRHKTTVHDNITRYSCQHVNCGYKSYDQASVKSHAKKVHEGVRKNETCKLCGKTFPSLSWHLAKVHKRITFPCEKCDKSLYFCYLLQGNTSDINQVFWTF